LSESSFPVTAADARYAARDDIYRDRQSTATWGASL